MNNRTILHSVAVLVALGLGAFGTVRVIQLGSTNGRVQDATAEIATARDAAIRDVQERATLGVKASTEETIKSGLKDFEERLQELTDEIEKRQKDLIELERDRQHIIKGLPGVVDLDDLGQNYSEILKKEGQYYAAAESFRTSVGEIAFSKGDIQVVRLPSNGNTVWVKIGKETSSENSELIRAWIYEAERAKTRLGYGREYRRVRPADYGEVTESLFRKGDLYFKTFLQYQRIQGTYGRHSLQYTYYVETGSVSRKERYELEQYNEKLGS